MTGHCTHNMDAKGRLFLPVKYRETLPSAKLHITVGLDGCLFCFDENEWAEFKAKVNSIPLVRRRDAERILLGCAEEVDIDGQGRILIPVALRDRIQLGQSVTIVGLNGRVEFWDADRWNAYSGVDDQTVLINALEEMNF